MTEHHHPVMEINTSELRKKKLFVATPMYGGMCSGFYTKAMLDLNTLCVKHGIDFQFLVLSNESLIHRARNYCADEFLRSNSTHLMFIDSDIEFNAIDVLALLQLSEPGTGHEVMCGAYPKKNISWEKIKSAVDKGVADANPFILEEFAGDFVFNPIATSGDVSLFEPFEVLESGTGFMMIQRDAFELLDKKFPNAKYKPDHARTKGFDGSRMIGHYFPSEVDPDSMRLLSEDYAFCQNVRKADGHIWMCPWMNIHHHGTYKFVGNLAAVAHIGASVTADMEQVKGLKK